MIKTVFIALDIATAADLVKKARPTAFRGTDAGAFATDVVLTAAAAVTVAPIALVGKVFGFVR